VSGVTSLPPVEDMGWYDCAGPAGGRPVVLVHGVEVTRKMWLLQVEGLAGEFRLLIPDLPAHGALADVLTPLSAYPGPILLLNGRWDWMFRRNEREFLAAAQHARLTVIHGGDHGCNMGRPTEFSAAVRQFAASLGW